MLTFAVATEARTVEFSGYTWTVKDVSLGGPGPNRWSDSTESVWIDNDGKLHLKVRQIAGQWYSAEVTMRQSLGHGRYEFMLETDTEAYDPGNVPEPGAAAVMGFGVVTFLKKRTHRRGR